MLITAIRDYIQLQGRANLQDVARHFRLSTSAVSYTHLTLPTICSV